MQNIVSLPLPPVCPVLECTIFCLSLAMTTQETNNMHEMNGKSVVTVTVQQASAAERGTERAAAGASAEIIYIGVPGWAMWGAANMALLLSCSRVPSIIFQTEPVESGAAGGQQVGLLRLRGQRRRGEGMASLQPSTGAKLLSVIHAAAGQQA